jgi:hypothetical protein
MRTRLPDTSMPPHLLARIAEVQQELARARTSITLPSAAALPSASSPPAKKRAKKPAPPPSPVPLDCAVLGVDPATLSGWAIWDRTQVVDYDECDLFGDGPASAIEVLLGLRGPHALVVEKPFKVRYENQTGIGTGERVWRELAKRMGVRCIVRVHPSTWRARMLGGEWTGARRAKVKEHEQKIALAVARKHIGADALVPGAEASPALLIGEWGTYAGEVKAKLPKRWRG